MHLWLHGLIIYSIRVSKWSTTCNLELGSSNQWLQSIIPFGFLTCLAERSFFEGKLGLEVGVTGALWLPLLNNDCRVSNHLILENNSDFQEVWTSQIRVGLKSLKEQLGTLRSSEVLLDVSRGIDGEEPRYRSRLQTRLVMICMLYRSCRSLIPLLPLLHQQSDTQSFSCISPAFLLPPSVAFPFAPSPSLSLSLSLSATPSPHFLPFQRPHLSFLHLTEQSPLGCPML